MSDTRTGAGMSRSASKTRRLSVHATTWLSSSAVKPQSTASSSFPAPSTVVMTAKRAPVSVRAASAISRSTVSSSRLALMRRMAAVSVEIRSRSASISRSLLLVLLMWLVLPDSTRSGPGRRPCWRAGLAQVYTKFARH